MQRFWISGCLLAVLALGGCGVFGGGGQRAQSEPVETPPADEIIDELLFEDRERPSSTIWDIFRTREEPGTVGDVNRFLWNASLQTLSFLPIETVDPFTGVIVTGFGTPPGGRTAYRATILIDDPALDARSLTVALNTRSGPASAETVRAVEDAILTRARQLRLEDSRF